MRKAFPVTAALFVLALSLVLVLAVAAVVIVGGTNVVGDGVPGAGVLRQANRALNGEGDVPELLHALFH